MAILTVGEFGPAGAATNLVAAAGGGDSFANDGKTFFEVLNGSGGSINVTFAVVEDIEGLALPDRVVAVGAGVRKRIGPFRPSRYNDSNDRVVVTYSAVTTVTVEAFKVES